MSDLSDMSDMSDLSDLSDLSDQKTLPTALLLEPEIIHLAH